MRFCKLSLSYFGSAAIAIMVVLPVAPAFSAATTVNDGINYDIPISELSKVKKKTPSKRARSESQKKKRSETKSRESSTGTADPLSKSENTQIYHSPYSFVAAGKPTVIYAVINSKADVQEVNCTLSAEEGGNNILVKMEKVNGTRFTYTATLPGLSSKNPYLRYTITFVDSLGKETRSRAFNTPVTLTPLVPGWQIENSAAADVAGAAGTAGATGTTGEK